MPYACFNKRRQIKSYFDPCQGERATGTALLGPYGLSQQLVNAVNASRVRFGGRLRCPSLKGKGMRGFMGLDAAFTSFPWCFHAHSN